MKQPSTASLTGVKQSTQAKYVFRSRAQAQPGIRYLSQPNDPALRVNAICPYYTMFPLGFPFSRLHRAWKGERVLDPFCGRGTTNFAARLRGLESVGVDSNPVAAAIAAAKLVNVRAGQVTRLAQSVLSARREPNNVPQGLFWDLCFERSTLRELCKMREHFLERCGTQTEMALRALILGILHGPRMKGPSTYLSNQMPRSYATKPGPAIGFWKARGIRPCRVDVVDAIHRRAKYVFGKAPAPTPGRIYLADSRYLDFPNAGGPFDWVVTSPPYYGMRSYWPDQWLRNWFLGGPEDVEYRHDHQVSHRSEAGFIDNLARVWREVASGCNPGARMIIRFGAIPSSRKDPAALLKRSLFEAGCGWRVLTIRDAGRASWGKRQSDQFNATTGTAVDEIDLYAVLEG